MRPHPRSVALLLLTLLVCPTPAAALFDIETLMGQRWYQSTSADVTTSWTARERAIAVHVDPFPAVPIALGGSIAVFSWDLPQDAPEIQAIKGYEGSVELKAWLPMVPVLTPYARLRYPVTATVTEKRHMDESQAGSEEQRHLMLRGSHLTLGVHWSPLPVLKVLVEGGAGRQRYRLDSLTIDDVKLEPPPPLEGHLNSSVVMVGIAIGM